MKHSFRLDGALRALGVVGLDALEDPLLAEIVQPVQLWGDAREVVPYLPASKAAAGGVVISGPNASPFLEVVAAPGGTMIEFLQWYPVDAVDYNVGYRAFLQTELLAAPLAGLSMVGATLNRWELVPERPAQTVVRIGSRQFADFPPAMNAGAAFEFAQPAHSQAFIPTHPWHYVPPGKILSVAAWTYAVSFPTTTWDAQLAIIFRDIPARIER